MMAQQVTPRANDNNNRKYSSCDYDISYYYALRTHNSIHIQQVDIVAERAMIIHACTVQINMF